MNVESNAAAILDRVKEKGAEGDLIVDEGQALSLKARDGELEEHKVSSSQIYGLRVIKDAHVGTAYSEAADEQALNSMVDQALINATFAKVEADEKILTTTGSLVTDDALLCPSDEVSIENKIQFVLDMEGNLAAKDKVQNVPHNSISDSIVQRRVFTSSGLDASLKQRMCVAGAYALMVDGDKNVMDGSGRAARQFDQLNYTDIVDEAYERCVGLLHGEPVPTKHYDLIFDEEFQVEVFSTFASMFSGKTAKDGVNPMRDKLGDIISDPRLSISDQPLLTDGFGYALFDSEGTATRATPLITNGRLETLIHNSATAAHFGVSTTGHGIRGPKSTLGVSLHQLHIDKGSDSPATLFSGEYLLITDLSGLHSGANPISGQFSFGAAGYLCRDGERIQPVRNITVAGNFYDMLKKVSAIGDELFWNLERSAFMPHIRFADVAVSG